MTAPTTDDAGRARLPVLLALLALYVAFAALYLWQASRRATLTIFSDEIEFTQISRAIADTGRAALRGGEPAAHASLYAYLAAPAWWLDSVSAGYTAIKSLGVLVMTATIFPAYGLARLVVSRPAAVVAATAATGAPALVYAPFLVEEPAAYPASTLALLLIARAGFRPGLGSIGVALGACVLAALVRTQLAVLLPVLALVLVASAWRTERARAWRRTWNRFDWIGGAMLLVGLALLLSAVLGKRSTTWYVATGFFKGRMLEYGLWAGGALAIGIGILPVIAALAALARPRGEREDEQVATFATLTAAAIAAFGFYTALKAAFLSTQFAIVVAERNLIYLYPLLFAATALLLERRRTRPLPLVAATAFALYLVTTTPYTLAQYPNYEAHGLSAAAFANRILRWPDDTIQLALIVVTLASAVLLALLPLVRRPAATALVVATAAFVLTWTVGTEVYAAHGERAASTAAYANLPKPPDWVDRATNGEPTVYVGQGIDAMSAWQVEFWNPSIRWFWGMDGTAPGPGERRTPNLLRPDGTQDPADLNAGYALAVNGVEIAAPKVATVGGAVLYRLAGDPVRLAQTTAGVSSDGWMSSDASYTRYAVEPDTRGFVKVSFSRLGACFPQLEPAEATVRVGPVGVDANDQPGLETTTATARETVPACQVVPVLLAVPDRPWRAEVSITPTFVPRELDPAQPDNRRLGAVVSFEFVPLGGG